MRVTLLFGYREKRSERQSATEVDFLSKIAALGDKTGAPEPVRDSALRCGCRHEFLPNQIRLGRYNLQFEPIPLAAFGTLLPFND